MKTTIKSLLLTLLLLTLSACSKVNSENFKKLEVGMGYEKIVALLGEPNKCDIVLNAKSCQWVDGEKKIDVKFFADNVVYYTGTGL